MFKTVHREIFREHLQVFALSLSCLLALILIGRLLQLRDLLLSQNLGPLEVAQLFLYLSPMFLQLIAPVAVMLSVFLTYLRMSTDRELTALRAGGVSLYQLVPATLVFCILASLFTLFISTVGQGWGMHHFRETLTEFARTRTRIAMQAGIFNQDFPGLTFFSRRVEGENGKELRYVFVEDTTHKGTTVNIVAPKAEVESASEDGVLRITFRNGQIYRRSGEKLDVLRFGAYTISLELTRLLGDLGFDARKPNGMTMGELYRLRDDPDIVAKIGKRNAAKLPVEIQKRYALPGGCLVLGLFALPVACVFRGLKQQYGLMLSMGFFFVYYSMFSMGVSLGEAQSADPVLALWIPNAIFAVLALYGMVLASREKNMMLMEWLRHLCFGWRRTC